MAGVVCTLHHHIGGESEFERGLGVCTHLDVFEDQISWIERNYNVIDLSTLLSGDLPSRPLLLTFDDTFCSVLDVAKTILSPRGLPAVYFINAGLLGRDSISLDSTLAWAISKFGINAVCKFIGVKPRNSVAEIVSTDMSVLDASSRARIKAKLLSEYSPTDFSKRAPPLEPSDLLELNRLGVEIGNHTLTHVHCRSLTPSDIENEIVTGKAELERLSGTKVRSFSIPYGNEHDLTPRVLGAIRESGHEAIFLVHARSNSHRPAPDVWYRTSLRNEAAMELRLRLSYLPALRSIKKNITG